MCSAITRLGERAIAEAERSCFYLIEGRDRDVLIDGGWGLATDLEDIRKAKPLAAVATHSHFDHIGALHLAETRIGHAAEADVYASPDPAVTQAVPWLDGRHVLADGGAIDMTTFAQTGCALTQTVADGDFIDLGDRTLTVIHTPGHSPGSIALFDAANGILFCGDTVHSGAIHDDIPGADRQALRRSHARLLELDFAVAYPGHGGGMDRERFRTIVLSHWGENPA